MKQPGLLWLPRRVRCDVTMSPAGALVAVLQVTQPGYTAPAHQISVHPTSSVAQQYLEPFRGMQIMPACLSGSHAAAAQHAAEL